MEMFAIIIILLVLIVIWYFIKSTKKPKHFPPGPKWYPILGCSFLVHSMTRKHGSQWKGLSELAKEYKTKVLGLKLGSEPLIIIYGENNVRRAFNEKAFDGRPKSFHRKKLGITFADGTLWRLHKQFTFKHLRTVGLGKMTMESEIQKEMQGISNNINMNIGKTIDPKNMLAAAIVNILWKFTAGEKIEHNRMNFLLYLLNDYVISSSWVGSCLDSWPWMRFLFPKISGYTLLKKINQKAYFVIEEAIEKHKKNLISKNDFIYSFLEEMKNNTETFTEELLKVTCLDIIIWGSQPASSAIEFAILKVMRDKTIQEKIYNEIINNLGDELPSWFDSDRLIYTKAFLFEIIRYFKIAPLAGPRRALDDVIMDGYVIPKESTLLISIGDVHVEPDIWEEPEKFMPERFIDKSGRMKNIEHLYIFGMGRRRCPGDTLAKSFMFIVFVGIMQRYRIECTNSVLPSEEPIIGLLAHARPFTAQFIPRN